jgi:predicted mannosyl-3-phosphoglycerate phosphatase (HAD superfamily)
MLPIVLGTTEIAVAHGFKDLPIVNHLLMAHMIGSSDKGIAKNVITIGAVNKIGSSNANNGWTEVLT